MEENVEVKDAETDLTIDDSEKAAAVKKTEDLKKDAKELGQKAGELFAEGAELAVGFVGERVKDAGVFFDKVNEGLQQAHEQKVLEKYKPIFDMNLSNVLPKMPAILNVVSDYDKKSKTKYPEAIGFEREINDEEILSVSLNDVGKYGIVLKPNKDESLYYVHPTERNTYICIDDYFKYLTTARITELKDIAHSLGATHVSIAIFEKEQSFSTKKVKGGGLLGFGKDKHQAEAEKAREKSETVQIGATIEAMFEKKEPEMPELKLFADDENIQSLIKHVLTDIGKQTYEKLKLDYNVCSGIKEKEAMKLDGVLKKLKFKLTGSIVEEAKKESNRHFEYTITF